MSINDLNDDGSVKWLIRGDGYSLCRQGDKWRADVANRAVPMRAPELTHNQAGLMLEKLRSDFRNDADNRAKVERLAFEMSVIGLVA